MITLQQITRLENLLRKMSPGPYEFWQQPDTNVLVSRCRTVEGQKVGEPMAALPCTEDQFRPVIELLNLAPDLIEAAKKGVK